MTKQTKWPTHVVAATWPPHRVARRVTAWQRRADWLPGARHHNTTAWRAKNSTDADVSTTMLDALSQGLWSGEGGAFHSARLLPSHTTHTSSQPAGRGGAALLKYKYIHVYIYIYGGREGRRERANAHEHTNTHTRTHTNTHEHTHTNTRTHEHTNTHTRTHTNTSTTTVAVREDAPRANRANKGANKKARITMATTTPSTHPRTLRPWLRATSIYFHSLSINRHLGGVC